MRSWALVVWIGILGIGTPLAADQQFSFTYRHELLESPGSLGLSLTSVDSATGMIELNGGDTRRPTIPFTFEWGDGQTTTGFFPQQHRYAQLKNSIVTVTANYGSGQTDSTQILVRLTEPVIQPVALPGGTEVTLATEGLPPTSRLLYPVPATLAPFGPADFRTVPRPALEYALTVIASVAKEMVNDDIALVNGAFRQQIWKDVGGGFYSLWYTNPVAVASGNGGFSASVPWSSLAHEIGHNVTLNFPAGYIFGGKIDGNANAIYSETMAQIFQHAVIYEVANNSTAYGLSSDLAFEIAASARSTIKVTRTNYDSYIASGKHYATWNDPATAIDETLPTFMTVAYKFLAKVEQSGRGYREPVRRLTAFLHLFNADWLTSFGAQTNSPDAETFRSTLMVAAASYALRQDLRQEFRDLGFPVSDSVFLALSAASDAPVITTVNTAGGGSEIAQNTWIEIKGRNLAPPGIPALGVTWSSAPEFASRQMPTQLEGVRVNVNGKAAYIYFVCGATEGSVCATDQVNVLTPLDHSIGTVEISVYRGAIASPPFGVNVQAITPSLLLLDENRHVAALHADNSLVGPVTLYPGVSTPAHPGETIVVYGVGFGLPTTQLTESSSNQSGELGLPITCRIGATEARVVFAGLISPGLYQFNMAVPPDTPDGDGLIRCAYGGGITPANNVITVRR